jgi:hypothetical protein
MAASAAASAPQYHRRLTTLAEAQYIMPTMLLLVVVIAIGATLMGKLGLWAGQRIRRDVIAQLQASETIIERRQIPEEWLAPYRAKIEALRSAGRDERDIARVGLKAQANCLHRMDQLILFFRKANVTDTANTKKIILKTLQSRREGLSAAPWQDLFAPPEAPAPLPAAPPPTNEGAGVSQGA